MPTINDVINSQLARVMANHGAPLRALAEKEASNEALANRIALAKSNNDMETARALQVLGAQQKFTEAENEKNRKARKEEAEDNRKAEMARIEAQAKAYVDRLTSADKQKELARLRALGIEIKGSSIDDQIADGLLKQAQGDYPKARGAVGLYKDYEKRISKLDDDISAAEEEDAAYVKSRSQSLAKQQAAEAMKMELSSDELKALGGSISEQSIRNSTKIPQKRRQELINALQAGEANAQTQMEIMLMSDKIERPSTSKLKALRNEKAKAETEFMRFQASEPGRLALDRMTFERSGVPVALESIPDDRAPDGIETAKAIVERLNSGATFNPVAGNARQRDEELINQPAAAAATQPKSAAAVGENPNAPYFGFSKDPSAVARFFRGYGYQDPTAPQLLDLLPEVSMPTAEGVRNRLDAMFAPVRDAGNAVGDWARNVDAKAAAIWGPDAVPMLKEAEKIATQRGMDPAEQRRIFDAAIGGDTNAQQKVSVMLDFVRQARASDRTGSFDVMVPLMPGVNAPQRSFPTVAPAAPPRMSIGPR